MGTRWIGILGASWAALVAACSDGGAGETGEHLGPPTWHRDVAPLVAERCVSCHVDGGIAPFALDRFEEAAPRAAAIRQAVESRTMPPWGVDASGACGEWAEPRWLSDEELAILAAWEEAGAPEGEPRPAPRPPEPDRLRSVDATFDIGATYLPDDRRHDDYRCFVVDPGLAEDRFLTAYEVRPGEPRVVHHVILYSLDSATAEADAGAMDAAEAGPGYTCFGGPGIDGSRFLAGWAPGTPVTRYPEGTGLALTAGRKLVLQVHYNLRTGALPDRTAVDLELADAVRPAHVIPVADFDMVLPPGEERVATSETTRATDLPVPVLLHGVFPHMHTLGRELRFDRLRPEGDECVADVPRWSFHWQQFYFVAEPLRIEAGERFRLECVYDTRDRTAPVTWGEGTEDEMCLVFLYLTLAP